MAVARRLHPPAADVDLRTDFGPTRQGSLGASIVRDYVAEMRGEIVDLEQHLETLHQRHTQAIPGVRRSPRVQAKSGRSPIESEEIITRPFLRPEGKSELGRAKLRKAVEAVFAEKEKRRVK